LIKRGLLFGSFYLMALLVNAASVYSQTNYKFEAIYIYSFTKYLSWPDNTIKNQFVVGIYGYSPMQQELVSVTNGKSVGDKSISVKNYNSLEEIENCQILFVSTEYEGDLPELTKIANTKHILLITDGNDMSGKGAGINLVNVDGKQKFELNEAAVKKAGLKISNQLIPLAILVK
jgi:hypothetical protein